MSPEELIEKVRDDLRHGKLRPEEITVRRVAEWLGKSTMVVYHHFGSLDGLWFAVGQSGMVLLGQRLIGKKLADVAEGFVRFGLEAPALYHVMFEHHYDWAALRKLGALKSDMPGLGMFKLLAAEVGSERTARILIAGLHGLVSLALSGRANVGALEMTDEAAALDAARELVRRLVPPKKEMQSHGPDQGTPRAGERRPPEKPPRQIGHERTAGRPRRRTK